MTIIDPDHVAGLLVEAAERFILPRYRALADHEIRSKSRPNDLVTQADLDVEEFLSAVLPPLMSGSVVVGEEAACADPAILNIFQQEDRAIWVVDPVDGTHNFVHHKPEFGVLLALVVNGEARCGWIYDVLNQRMAIAERGSGAYLNQVRMRVQPLPAAAEMTGFANPQFFLKDHRQHIRTAAKAIKDWQALHCAAHEYLRVASGAAQFALYSRLKPWDHVAGTLMVEEAGGVARLWSGERYRPGALDVGLIAAAGPENWQQCFDLFVKPLADL